MLRRLRARAGQAVDPPALLRPRRPLTRSSLRGWVRQRPRHTSGASGSRRTCSGLRARRSKRRPTEQTPLAHTVKNGCFPADLLHLGGACCPTDAHLQQTRTHCQRTLASSCVSGKGLPTPAARPHRRWAGESAVGPTKPLDDGRLETRCGMSRRTPGPLPRSVCARPLPRSHCGDALRSPHPRPHTPERPLQIAPPCPGKQRPGPHLETTLHDR